MSRREDLEDLAITYENRGYETLSIDSAYPGIFEEEVPEHEVEGRVDVLLEEPNVSQLKVVQVGCLESLRPETIRDKYEAKQERANDAVEYFNSLDLDYNQIVGEGVLIPQKELKLLKEIWQGTTGIFSWSDAVEAVSEPERIGGLKHDVIVEWVNAPEHQEKYEIDEEYEGVIDIFNEGLI